MDTRKTVDGGDENEKLLRNSCNAISPSVTPSSCRKRKLDTVQSVDPQNAKKLAVTDPSPTEQGQTPAFTATPLEKNGSYYRPTGKICTFPGCDRFYRSGSRFCVAHGGGRRCKFSECTKSAQGRTDYCSAHGGGKRCQFKNCDKGARGRSSFCIAHGAEKKEEGKDQKKIPPTVLKEVQDSPPSFSKLSSQHRGPEIWPEYYCPSRNLFPSSMFPSVLPPHFHHLARSQFEYSMFMNMIRSHPYSRDPRLYLPHRNPAIHSWTAMKLATIPSERMLNARREGPTGR